jgi:hypothetical protein
MASEICKGCDFYKPQYYRLLGRECAPYGTCTENDYCGTRIPPLPKDYPGRFIPPKGRTQNTETQAIAEVEGKGNAHGD